MERKRWKCWGLFFTFGLLLLGTSLYSHDTVPSDRDPLRQVSTTPPPTLPSIPQEGARPKSLHLVSTTSVPRFTPMIKRGESDVPETAPNPSMTLEQAAKPLPSNKQSYVSSSPTTLALLPKGTISTCKKILWFTATVWKENSTTTTDDEDEEEPLPQRGKDGHIGSAERVAWSTFLKVSLTSAWKNAPGLVPIVWIYTESGEEPTLGGSHVGSSPSFIFIKSLVEDQMKGLVVVKKISESYVHKLLNKSLGANASRTYNRSDVWTAPIGRLGLLHFIRDELPRTPLAHQSLDDGWARWEDLLDPKKGDVDEAKTLYTDTDTLFMPAFDHCELPLPNLLAMGPEREKYHTFPGNAGVVLINRLNFKPALMDRIMERELTRNKENPFRNVDQSLLNDHFEDKIDKLSPSFNYRCQWGGPAKDAAIVHWVGPKPGKGGCLDCIVEPPVVPAHGCGCAQEWMYEEWRWFWETSYVTDRSAFCLETVRLFFEVARWSDNVQEWTSGGNGGTTSSNKSLSQVWSTPPFQLRKRFSVQLRYRIGVAASLQNLVEVLVALRSNFLYARNLLPTVVLPYSSPLPPEEQLQDNIPFWKAVNHPVLSSLCSVVEPQDLLSPNKGRNGTIASLSPPIICLNTTREIIALVYHLVKQLQGDLVFASPLTETSVAGKALMRSRGMPSDSFDSLNITKDHLDYITSTFSKFDLTVKHGQKVPKRVVPVTMRDNYLNPKKRHHHDDEEDTASSVMDETRKLMVPSSIIFSPAFDVNYLPSSVKVKKAASATIDDFSSPSEQSVVLLHSFKVDDAVALIEHGATRGLKEEESALALLKSVFTMQGVPMTEFRSSVVARSANSGTKKKRFDREPPLFYSFPAEISGAVSLSGLNQSSVEWIQWMELLDHKDLCRYR